MELTPPTPYRMSLTAAQVEELLLSIYTKLSSDTIRTSLSSPDDLTIPTTKAVADAIAVINSDLEQLGALSLLDELNLGSNNVVGTLPISKGGTGAADLNQAQLNLGIVVESAIQQMIDNSIPNIQSVDLGSSQVTGVLSISKGGTGANNVGQARQNLGVWSSGQSEILKIYMLEALRRTYAEAGFTLVPGSFELGGTVNASTDVLLYEANGHAYNWDGVLLGGDKVVPQNSTPATTGGVGPDLWLDQGSSALRVQLSSVTGANMVGACPSVSVLRSIEPTGNAQRIDVNSYYDDWAVVVDGEPKYGGRFWYDPNDSTTADDGFKVIVTTGGKRWKRINGTYTVGHAGAREDLSVDSTSQVQAAVNGTKSGKELGFYGGPFMWEKVDLTKPIVLVGDANLVHNGFRIKTSGVHSRLTGQQECKAYATSSRAFESLANTDAADYEDLQILFNKFDGYFYSTAFIARDYSLVIDPAARVIKNTKIIGCTSIAPSGFNAGHFQHIGVTNSEASHNTTRGGQGATSYNFINQNGYVRIIGNYDENNSYGSCELENSTVSNSVISANTFGSDLWVDDTSNVTIVGNITAGTLRITAETSDVRNLTISGNTAKRLRVEQFGGSPTGLVYDSNVSGNTVTGSDPGGNDIFLGALITGEVATNRCNGPTTHIGIVRHPTSNLVVRNNSGKGGALLISGVGGTIIEYGNIGLVPSGDSDSKHLSNLMKPSPAYLDLPGKYLHGTKYTGSISPGGTAAISLPIPAGLDPSFRGVALWVLIRDIGSNNISSYRIDGRYVYAGSVQLAFGTAYSSQGIDAGSVAVANNSSTTSSINILLTNTSGTKTLQVTVMPEVSSRLGTEE